MHAVHGRPAPSGAVASSSGVGCGRSPGCSSLGALRSPPGALGCRHASHGAQRGRHVVLCAGERLVSGALFAGPSREVEEEQSWGRGRPTAAVLVPSLDAITAPVREDLAACNANLMNVVGQRHPMLMAAAERIFGAGGKKLRPVLCFLVARATAQACGLSDLTPRHRKLAEITEMIHTASLVHDDVLDDTDLRRGTSTVHTVYGTRVAVLVGDYLFAQSSWFLANLDNLEVIKLISQVIADFANGEISQAGSLFNTDIGLETYTDKSFYKTASLIAASCRSEAVFSGADEALKADMYEYGRSLGLAFQIVDDILDFTQSTEQLGKPQGQDLASGNLTAPVICALKSPNGGARLRELIDSEFQEEGGLQEALRLVETTGGLDAARQLAKQHGDAARQALHRLPPCEAKRGLDCMVDYVLQRVT